MPARELTVVVIEYHERRCNHRLLFGQPTLRVRRGWRRELAAFEPGSVFGYARWTRNRYGTTEWRVMVCRAFGDGPVVRMPGVQPGAQLLLSASGKARVERILALVDALKDRRGGPAALPAAWWRRVHNAVETGADLPPRLLAERQPFPHASAC